MKTLIKFKNGIKAIWKRLTKKFWLTLIGIGAGLLAGRFFFILFLIFASLIAREFISSPVEWLNIFLVSITTIPILLFASLNTVTMTIIATLGGIIAITDIAIYEEAISKIKQEKESMNKLEASEYTIIEPVMEA